MPLKRIKEILSFQHIDSYQDEINFKWHILCMVIHILTLLAIKSLCEYYGYGNIFGVYLNL